MVSLRHAAKTLGLNIITLNKAIDKGQIKAVRIGSRLRIPEAELERLMSPLKTEDEKNARDLDGTTGKKEEVYL